MQENYNLLFFLELIEQLTVFIDEQDIEKKFIDILTVSIGNTSYLGYFYDLVLRSKNSGFWILINSFIHLLNNFLFINYILDFLKDILERLKVANGQHSILKLLKKYSKDIPTTIIKILEKIQVKMYPFI